MPFDRRPDYAPIGFTFRVVSVSVSSEASARLAGVGPFAGLFFKTTASVTFVDINTTSSLTVSDVAANTVLWISGNFCSVIATATSVYALT